MKEQKKSGKEPRSTTAPRVTKRYRLFYECESPTNNNYEKKYYSIKNIKESLHGHKA